MVEEIDSAVSDTAAVDDLTTLFDSSTKEVGTEDSK